MKYLFLLLIRIYQHFPRSLLFIEKGSCRFSPTCSKYCYQAIDNHGTIRGLFLCIKRVSRCNPFT